jgi:hypothetical protein
MSEKEKFIWKWNLEKYHLIYGIKIILIKFIIIDFKYWLRQFYYYDLGFYFGD